jgi:hypothetical protein
MAERRAVDVCRQAAVVNGSPTQSDSFQIHPAVWAHPLCWHLASASHWLLPQAACLGVGILMVVYILVAWLWGSVAFAWRGRENDTTIAARVSHFALATQRILTECVWGVTFEGSKIDERHQRRWTPTTNQDVNGSIWPVATDNQGDAAPPRDTHGHISNGARQQSTAPHLSGDGSRSQWCRRKQRRPPAAVAPGLMRCTGSHLTPRLGLS